MVGGGGRKKHVYLGIPGQVRFFQLRKGNSTLEGLGTSTLEVKVANSGLLKYEGFRDKIALGLSPKGNRGLSPVKR